MINFIYVFVGGGLGAMSRYSLSKFLPVSENGFPFHTFLANVLSSLLLGYLFGYLVQNNISSKNQLLLMTGFCGGFSTFSTYALESFQFLSNGAFNMAIIYSLLSIVICVSCIWLGYKLAL